MNCLTTRYIRQISTAWQVALCYSSKHPRLSVCKENKYTSCHSLELFSFIMVALPLSLWSLWQNTTFHFRTRRQGGVVAAETSGLSPHEHHPNQYLAQPGCWTHRSAPSELQLNSPPALPSCEPRLLFVPANLRKYIYIYIK